MTKHPCQGMTKAEITAFEAIAINRSPNCSKKTIEKLLVIVDEKRNVNFKDGLPPVAVDDYFVPLPIHYQWCQWVSERYRGTI